MSISAIGSVNSMTSFKAAEATTPISANEQILPKYYEQPAMMESPKEKKGFFNRLKEGFINIRKFFITTGHMAAGTVKGAVYGGITGLATLGAFALKNTVKKAPEILTKGNKAAAIAIGAGVLAVELVKAKLNANDRGADLDHKWRTGHDRN